MNEKQLLDLLLLQPCIIVNASLTGRVQQSWVANPMGRAERLGTELPTRIIGRDSNGAILEVRKITRIEPAEFESWRRVDFFGPQPRVYLPLKGVMLPKELLCRSPIRYVNC